MVQFFYASQCTNNVLTNKQDNTLAVILIDISELAVTYIRIYRPCWSISGISQTVHIFACWIPVILVYRSLIGSRRHVGYINWHHCWRPCTLKIFETFLVVYKIIKMADIASIELSYRNRNLKIAFTVTQSQDRKRGNSSSTRSLRGECISRPTYNVIDYCLFYFY